MAVSPQRHLKAQQRAPTTLISRHRSPARTQRASPAQSPRSSRHNGSASSTHTAPREPAQPVEPTAQQQQEAKKQELVKKLHNFVKSTSMKQALETGIPSMAWPRSRESSQGASSCDHQSWREKLTKNKQETLQVLNTKAAGMHYNESMTQEQVGQSLEASLGDDLATFAGYQGAIHSVMKDGLKNEMLEDFLFDEEAEQQLTTYEKWEVIRHAAEQMLQVYANRSNSSWIEAEQWKRPNVVDAATIAQSGYANAVDRAMSHGEVALLFIDDGRQCQYSVQAGDLSPLIVTDLWQAVKELAPHKVPSTQRLEHVTVAGRHLLQASVSIETWYGAAALRRTKTVVAVDTEQEHSFISELHKWNYFGFTPDNLVILPLPRFHGFAEDRRTGRLAHVKNSAKLMLGTGYALFLLNSPAEAYTLTPSGEPRCLSGSVLTWLDEQNTSLISTGLFSDVQRLRPDALVDVEFLAAALFCSERTGCNVAMEVVPGESERDVRFHDSIVLQRQGEAGNCNLRASSMRTVRSYQIIQQHCTAPLSSPASTSPSRTSSSPSPSPSPSPAGGASAPFYCATQRYAFKVTALQQLLSDPMHFHMDVIMHGFCAYANFDLADITTSRNSSCACIIAGGLKGPPMADVVMGKSWLESTAAPVLELQDKVPEFRFKAMELLQLERPRSIVSPSTRTSAGSAFKERRTGSSVVLLMAMEHGRLGMAAMRMARLFVHNIVDRLHLVAVVGPGDSRQAAQALLEDMLDKELDFQGQVVREVLARESQGGDTMTMIRSYCRSVNANLVVVPSIKLSAPPSSSDLGMASLALMVARSLTTVPILLVKAASVGRLSTPRLSGSSGNLNAGSTLTQTGSSSRQGLVVMCHLEAAQASSLVEAVTPFLAPSMDLLYLARTQAFEKPGQLSMRSRRMFVQARMAVASALRVEERAYSQTASLELPKAVETENVDLLVVSASGSLAPSKEVEGILRSVKSCVYVHRAIDASPPGGGAVNNFFVT